MPPSTKPRAKPYLVVGMCRATRTMAYLSHSAINKGQRPQASSVTTSTGPEIASQQWHQRYQQHAINAISSTSAPSTPSAAPARHQRHQQQQAAAWWCAGGDSLGPGRGQTGGACRVTGHAPAPPNDASQLVVRHVQHKTPTSPQRTGPRPHTPAPGATGCVCGGAPLARGQAFRQ